MELSGVPKVVVGGGGSLVCLILNTLRRIVFPAFAHTVDATVTINLSFSL